MIVFISRVERAKNWQPGEMGASWSSVTMCLLVASSLVSVLS